jgi:hypothetical protein
MLEQVLIEKVRQLSRKPAPSNGLSEPGGPTPCFRLLRRVNASRRLPRASFARDKDLKSNKESSS